MASEFDTNRKSFIFTWILENFDYCWQRTGKLFLSPDFVVDTIEKTKWYMTIYPRGDKARDWISLYLHKDPECKGPATVEVDYEITLLGTDGSVVREEEVNEYAFSKRTGHGYPEFIKREYVFQKRSIFLPEGALTIRCRMWKSMGEVEMDGQCVARTHIGVERKTFLWKIPNFSTFDDGRGNTYELRSAADDKSIMSLNLCLRSNTIIIKFIPSNKKILFSTFKSFLINTQGDYVDCGAHEFWPSTTVEEECTLSFSKHKLMENNCVYLPNDVLTLYCELAFSNGAVLKVTESSSYGCSNSFISNNIVPENIKTVSVQKTCSNTYSDLQMDLRSMLQDNILCDIKLCTKTETFPAHWIILSARSPVFRAMFQSEMKEKLGDRIDIEDLKPDTIRRMLLYMYTDSLENLHWESASDLYIAAEKYQIMRLKEKCSSFLKTNLSPANACEILLLADLHQDKELKSAVQDFILENDKNIINSSEWKLLMEANVHLAAETMLLKFKK